MKLKKLILEGFKSFADRTEFEFDEGISCVVGPNGCGKSNIVDAVKWVLGEQSAKSLRGSEMLDVIFNGSANRRPSGSAQVTLIFDNGSGMLQPAPDAAGESTSVVAVARRLFRNGHSEYLINKHTCRLKDIREMFMDTGVGRDAYSLIEQGSIETFLQGSREDRRAIFDEAAGISKYKARKTEAMRKLERVEQNLLRLSDILGEVQKRLRSIKRQASKARSYQAHSQRLKQLRCLYFLAQYHELSARRKQLQRQLDGGTDALAAVTARIAQLEAAQGSTELEMLETERIGRDLQKQIADIGASIITLQERAEMLRGRVDELGEQIVAICARCEATEAKIASGQEQIARRRAEADQIEADSADLTARHETVSDQHETTRARLDKLQEQLEDEKAGTIDLLRRTAQLHNDIQAHGVRRKDLTGQRDRLSDRARQLTATLQELLGERAEGGEKLRDVQEVLGESRQRLEKSKDDLKTASTEQRDLQHLLGRTREHRSAVLSRMDVLREMQQRMEGIGAGARNLLKASRCGELPAIRGMLGDFIQTDVKYAPLVEAALCGAQEHLLAERQDDIVKAAEDLAKRIGDGGAVQIICLDQLEPFTSDLDISRIARATGRLIDYVRCHADFAAVMWRLLGKTVVVADLPDAIHAAAGAPADVMFVTLQGDVLQADGRIRIGSAKPAGGVITRRSELADLAGQKDQLDGRIDQLTEQLRQSAARSDHLEHLIQQMRTAIYEANTERIATQTRLDQLNEKVDALRHEQPVVASDIENLAAEIDNTIGAEHEAKTQADQLDRRGAERDEAIKDLAGRIEVAQGRRDELAATLTHLKVQQAAVEQKKLSLTQTLRALGEQIDQMSEDLAAGRAEIDAGRARRSDAQTEITKTQAQVDRQYAAQEELNRTADEADESRRGLGEKLEQIRAELTERRREKEHAASELNTRKVQLGEVDVRVENLITRAADDLSMDLPKLFERYSHDDQRDWDAVAAEIDELRGRVERLGSVNLDAIGEQDELQTRSEFLTTQLDDIRASRDKLNELIRRINTESRDRFAESFEVIRRNFQELFRKLFGGGRADVMLLDPEDVLESPIEIFARPPGKELRSLSLLSGGEKTMTALALLFSIFKAKPSPFCLLDEVDAALDETNNDRFNRLVAEFVPNSQFIIISHAKRTISMANVLYGVTMQEPGVSKRISVRFDQIADAKLDEALEPVEA